MSRLAALNEKHSRRRPPENNGGSPLAQDGHGFKAPLPVREAQSAVARLDAEQALLEADSRRIAQQLEGGDMRSQRAGLAQAESFLSVKLAEMAQLEERQLEINKLFRAVHSEKLSLQELADHASRLRNEQREQEKQAQLLDQESATHVARAEQIAKALSSARDHAELNRLERDLNASIELAESCSAGLSAAKGTAEAKAQDADQAAAEVKRRTQDAGSIQSLAAERSKELPIIVAAMEAAAGAIARAEVDLKRRQGLMEAAESALRQRLGSNEEAVGTTRSMRATAEQRAALEARERSRTAVSARHHQGDAVEPTQAQRVGFRGGQSASPVRAAKSPSRSGGRRAESPQRAKEDLSSERAQLEKQYKQLGRQQAEVEKLQRELQVRRQAVLQRGVG
jgi:hypothetical protein